MIFGAKNWTTKTDGQKLSDKILAVKNLLVGVEDQTASGIACQKVQLSFLTI